MCALLASLEYLLSLYYAASSTATSKEVSFGVAMRGGQSHSPTVTDERGGGRSSVDIEPGPRNDDPQKWNEVFYRNSCSFDARTL